MKVTDNFSLSEFECNCGCKMPDKVKENIILLANQLQVVRDFIKQPMELTNGYRCAEHNKKVGGVPNSQHVLGMAADIKVKMLSPKKLADTINLLASKGNIVEGGIGVYKTFTHYDIRGTKARWDYR